MSHLFLRSLSCCFAPFYWQFEKDLESPQKAQNRVKRKVIYKLNKTAYGSGLNVKDIEDWQHIPIVNYDRIESWIIQQRQQPLNPILTPEKVHFWECTSGSTGTKKWIPYTTSLLNSFSNMFCIWAHDLMCSDLQLSTGKTYLCISPEIGESRQGTDDSAYIHPILQWLISRFLVRVQGRFPTVEDFRLALACTLLETPDLEVFSLWNPSFLTTQLNFMQANQEKLQYLLKDRISSKRLKLLGESQIPWRELWLELKLISCWDRQYAADSAQTLRDYFSGVFLQGKGLLATEAPMTIPIIDAKGFVPLLNQVVLEFLTPNGEVRDLTQLETGVNYELVISQLGGLTRYQIGDRVQVSHWYKDTPCLDFVGRGEEISDLVGEKLSVQFVTECLSKLGYLQWGFCCLVPIKGNPPHYCLLLEQSPQGEDEIAPQLEMMLQENFHYHKARQFGQLDPAKVIIHPQVTQWLQGSRRLGDCKYPVLVTNTVAPESKLMCI